MHALPCRPLACLLSLALLAAPAFAASPPADAANASATVPAGMRVALQRDLDVAPERIAQYLAANARMPALERDARAALGARYAGSWLERDARGEYVPVVAVAGADGAARAGTLGARVRVVAHGLARLQAARGQLDAAARALRGKGAAGGVDPGIHAWHVDPASNRVVVTTDRGRTRAAAGFVAASGVDAALVRYVQADGRPRPAQAVFDIRGGDRYDVPGGWCSIGFAATVGAENGFITAGHCGSAGTPVSRNGRSLGYFYGSVFPGSDFAVVHNTNPAGIPRPWVNAYDYGGNLDVRGSTPAAVGAAVCRSGARTGARCGTLLATGVTVNYGASGMVYGLSWSDACVGTGDSGGAFITPDGQAQGVTSGGSFVSGSTENCTIGSPSTYYQPVQSILAHYPGLALVLAP